MTYFDSIFRLFVKHDYYKDNVFEGIRFQPTPTTIQSLKNNRFIVKQRGPELIVAFEGPVRKMPFIIPDTGLQLIFFLEITDLEEFVNITDLDQSNGTMRNFNSGNVFVFRNQGLTNQDLQFGLIDEVKPKVFNYTLPVMGNTDATLEVINHLGNSVCIGRDSNGNLISSPVQISPNADDQYIVSIDLRRENDGLYSFKSTIDGTENSRDFYITSQPLKPKTLGLLFIELPQLTAPVNSVRFNMQLRSRRLQWLYNIRLDSDKFFLEDLEIEDSTYTFTRQALSVEDKTVKFQSDEFNKIPYKEVPYSGIKLKSGTKVLVSSMPNASPRGSVDKDGKAQIHVVI